MHVHVHGAGGPTRVLKISLGLTLAYILLLVVAGIRALPSPCFPRPGVIFRIFLPFYSPDRGDFRVTPGQCQQDLWVPARRGVLAALVDASSLVVVSFFIFYEAFRRLQHPEMSVHCGLMMWVAGAG